MVYSVLGSLVIVCGLYSVLLGKNKEMKRIAQLMPESSSDEVEKRNKEEEEEEEENSGRKKENGLDVVASDPTFLSILAPAPDVVVVLSTSASQRISTSIDVEDYDQDDQEIGISKPNNININGGKT